MTISRRLARPLLSSVLVLGGVDALRRPESKLPAAQKVLGPLSEKVPLPAEHKDLVRLNGGVQAVAGVALATGRFPRLASLALAGSLVPTTLAGHRFWEEDDPAARANQRIHFFKNASLIGGLLISAMDTEGSPSIGYRARRRASQVGDVVGDAAGAVLPG